MQTRQEVPQIILICWLNVCGNLQTGWVLGVNCSSRRLYVSPQLGGLGRLRTWRLSFSDLFRVHWRLLHLGVKRSSIVELTVNWSTVSAVYRQCQAFHNDRLCPGGGDQTCARATTQCVRKGGLIDHAVMVAATITSCWSPPACLPRLKSVPSTPVVKKARQYMTIRFGLLKLVLVALQSIIVVHCWSAVSECCARSVV